MIEKRISPMVLIILSVLVVGCKTPPEEAVTLTGQPTEQIPQPGASVDPDLLAVEWQLVSYGPITDAIPVLQNTTVTLIFNEDGTVGGAGGCNGYGGYYSASAGQITFTELISTMMACENPVMTQEQTVLSALQAASFYQKSGQMLAIVYEDDKALIFTSAVVATQPPDGGGESAWQLSITAPEDGELIDPSQPLTITGTGQGLFEGGLLVEIIDEGGDVLVLEPVTLQGEDVGVGGAGEWSLVVTPGAATGTIGQIHAYATSPEDGRIMVEDFVSVSFD